MKINAVLTSVICALLIFLSCAKESDAIKLQKLSESYTNKLKLYSESGNAKHEYLNQALEISNRIIALQPLELSGYLKNAIVNVKLKNDADAIKSLELIKGRAELTPEALIMLGALYDRAGRKQEALQCFSGALSHLDRTQMNPSDREMNRIFVHAFIDGREKALIMAQQFAKGRHAEPVVMKFLQVIGEFDRDKFLENL